MSLNTIPSKSNHATVQNSKLHPSYCRFVKCFMSFVGHMPLTSRDSLKHDQARSQMKFLVIPFDIFTAKTVHKTMKALGAPSILKDVSFPVLSASLLLEMSWLISAHRDWTDWSVTKMTLMKWQKLLEKSSEVSNEAKAVNYRSFRPRL